MNEQKPISIEAINEDTLKAATIGECESLLAAMNAMSGTLRAKAHLVHAAMEAKQAAQTAARKNGQLSESDKAALKAHWAEEEKINTDPKLSAKEKEFALARLNHIEIAPPAQHLDGSHITRDDDSVKPGNDKRI